MLDHYHKTEHLFVKKIIKLKNKLIQNETPYVSKFLTPREVHIVTEIFGKDLEYTFDGGLKNNERKKLCVNTEESKIDCLEILHNKKYNKLNHKNILGSLLRLGIERENFGDIFVGSRSFIMICNEFSEYVHQHLHKINKASIQFKKIKTEKIDLEFAESYNERLYYLKSFRIDAIISYVYHISRQESKALFPKDKIKLNHGYISNPNLEFKEGDLISVRGQGRFRVLKVKGQSRSERFIINVGKIV